jgi:peptidoglycan/LPS O-acetylase OafA/YrhL
LTRAPEYRFDIIHSDQLHWFTETMLYSVVFSTVVFGLVLIQDASPSFGRRAKVIGDISYSTYLLHFPVTLLLVLLNKAGWTNLNFDLGSIWLLYFAIVIGLAIPTYYKFEMPMQNRLRRMMLRTVREKPITTENASPDTGGEIWPPPLPSPLLMNRSQLITSLPVTVPTD